MDQIDSRNQLRQQRRKIVDERLRNLVQKRRQLREGVFVGRPGLRLESAKVKGRAIGLPSEWLELLKKYGGEKKVSEVIKTERRKVI